MTSYIGVGELLVSSLNGETLKTMALGSCIAVIAFCRKSDLTGMLHVQLPNSSLNPALAATLPGKFADTGIKALLLPFKEAGYTNKDIIIKLAGGAQIMDPKGTFNIGKRNYLAIKKILWANRLWPSAEDIGGEHSRSVTLHVGKHDVVITSPTKEEKVI